MSIKKILFLIGYFLGFGFCLGAVFTILIILINLWINGSYQFYEPSLNILQIELALMGFALIIIFIYSLYLLKIALILFEIKEEKENERGL